MTGAAAVHTVSLKAFDIGRFRKWQITPVSRLGQDFPTTSNRNPTFGSQDCMRSQHVQTNATSKTSELIRKTSYLDQVTGPSSIMHGTRADAQFWRHVQCRSPARPRSQRAPQDLVNTTPTHTITNLLKTLSQAVSHAANGTRGARSIQHSMMGDMDSRTIASTGEHQSDCVYRLTAERSIAPDHQLTACAPRPDADPGCR
jgi:hypothetical protein